MSQQREWTQDEIDLDMETEDCPNCAGEGVYYDCFDGFCVNAEEGCELCARTCDWCNGKG